MKWRHVLTIEHFTRITFLPVSSDDPSLKVIILCKTHPIISYFLYYKYSGACLTSRVAYKLIEGKNQRLLLFFLISLIHCAIYRITVNVTE